MHIRLYIMNVKLQCQKGLLTEKLCNCGCHQLWTWVECPCELIKFALLEIRCHASSYRKSDGSMNTEIPGCQKFNEPHPKEIFKKSIVYSCNLGQKGQQETKKTIVKHIKWRLGLDIIWVRKPMKLCTLANKLQWCIQVTKLVNHWLVLMIEEVGAPVSNLPNARRV